MSDMSVFRYRLFGLNLFSDLELPELNPTLEREVDVTIRLVDNLPPAGDCLSIDGVATYFVPDEGTIEVAPQPGSHPQEVRLFLLGSAMAMLLYRRHDLPLHANAVLVDGGAWAFVGASGAGKSTLAQWFVGQGSALLADDVCVVRTAVEGSPMAYGGVPRLRLWEDAVVRAGYDPEALPLSVPGATGYRKFDVAKPDGPGVDAAPLVVLCLLEQAEHWSVEPLIGLAAVEALFAHSYRGGHVGTIGDPERHWRSCVALARTVPMFRYCRTMEVERIAEENAAAVDAIEKAMRGRRR